MSIKARNFLFGTALGVCALVSVGASAAAQVVVQSAYGGGTRVGAWTLRQAEDCYGVKTDLVTRNGGGITSNAVPDFNYTGSPAFNCATQIIEPNRQLFYLGADSERGIRGILSGWKFMLGDISPAAGQQFWPDVNYALSTIPLETADVTVYNSGGTAHGVTVVAPGVTANPPTTFDNPKATRGALIQVPAFIVPVVIAFDPVYQKTRNANGTITEYKFNLFKKRTDGSGGLRLDQDAMCRIFNGYYPLNGDRIINWNSWRLRSLNGGVSLKDPADPTSTANWSVPIQIVGRAEVSGVTLIWTRHLAAACFGLFYNQYKNGTTTLPDSIKGAIWDKSLPTNDAPLNEQVGRYTMTVGDDGVARYIDFSRNPGSANGSTLKQGRIGYLTPEHVLPSVTVTQYNNYGLQTADIRNTSGWYRTPTIYNMIAAFDDFGPPDSTSTGAYNAGASDPRDRTKPQDWVDAFFSFPSPTRVPATDRFHPLTLSTLKGYPLLGTANFLTYTCHATFDAKLATRWFLGWYYSSKTVNDKSSGLLRKNGFSPMPDNWRKAIIDTFITNTTPLNLAIEKQNTGTPQCP